MSSSPYQPAATLLNQLLEQDNKTKKRKSLKNLVFDDKTGQLKCSKTTYAQVCHVQKHLVTLKAVWEKYVRKHSPPTVQNEGLLYVLLYELLLGPNLSIRGGGQLKRQLTKQEAKLRNFLQEVQPLSAKNGDIENTDSDIDIWPRYIRVNTCQTTTQQVVNTLRTILTDSKLKIYLDPHVPDLLVVPSQATPLILANVNCVTGQVFLLSRSVSHVFTDARQKIASPFELIDACAAPGNKTTHLAALAANYFNQQKGKSKISIHAFDRDEKRHELLQRRCQTLVGDKSDRVMIKTKQQDFLAVDPSEYSHVRGILLDPTCSGSGMRDNLQKSHHAEDEERMEKLSYFQYRALLHACSFPQVEYIVYSTCSINEQENEAVVQRVLTESPAGVWYRPCVGTLEATWKTDDGTDDATKHMIRVDPTEDETNGFFVCCLARSNPDSLIKLDASMPRKSIEKQAKALGLPVYSSNTFAADAKDKMKRLLGEQSKPLQKVKKEKPNNSESKEKSSKSLTSKSDAALSKKKNEKRNLTDEAPSSKKAKKARTSNAEGTKETAKTIDSTSKDSGVEDNKHAKKRAKRLEWKQKQREAKLKRLQVVNPK